MIFSNTLLKFGSSFIYARLQQYIGSVYRAGQKMEHMRIGKLSCIRNDNAVSPMTSRHNYEYKNLLFRNLYVFLYVYKIKTATSY